MPQNLYIVYQSRPVLTYQTSVLNLVDIFFSAVRPPVAVHPVGFEDAARRGEPATSIEERCIVTLYDAKSGLYNSECPICFERFTMETRILNMPCGHAACERCGERCTATSHRCPVCRAPFL